ncbi:SIS domain-containing protein [Bacteroidota bacterium]
MEVKEYLENVKKVFDEIDKTEVETMLHHILEAYDNRKMIFVIGNGGSAANASHFAEDLSKGVITDQNVEKRIRAISLADNVPFITASANDSGYENIFVSQLITFANPDDYLIAISGSGNSKNIIKAVEYSKIRRINVIGVTGYDGGKLKELCDISVHVPLNEMCTVESIHSIIFHYITGHLREVLTGEKFNTPSFH